VGISQDLTNPVIDIDEPAPIVDLDNADCGVVKYSLKPLLALAKVVLCLLLLAHVDTNANLDSVS
jgi:hypothetical protein